MQTSSEHRTMHRVSAPFARLIASLTETRAGDRLDLVGLPPAGRGWILARVLLETGRRAVVVATDEAAADRLAADLQLFLSGALGPPAADAPRVVRLPADEVLPYDELSPDRGTVLQRLAALHHLAAGRPEVLAVVLSARSLSRRVVPRAVMGGHGEEVALGGRVHRDDLARRLVLAGYQNVPMVEDPGTFSVRGDIVDVFSPVYEQPARIELFGDDVESVRLFDPESQRTTTAVERLRLSPAHETLFGPEFVRRAVLGVRDLAGDLGRPSRKVRALLDDIEAGRPAFGVEAMLPAFYQGGLAPVAEYLTDFDLAFIDDPLSIEAALADTWDRLAADHEAHRTREELAYPPEAHFLGPEASLGQLGSTVRLEVHEVLVEGTGHPRLAPVRFDLRSTSDLRREILDHHGEEGALTPLVRRLEKWREEGRATLVACASEGQLDRIRRLLLDRQLMARRLEQPLDPRDPTATYDPAVHAQLVVGELSGGFVDPEAGLALLSDADILGAHQARRRARGRNLKPEEAFTAAFRELSEGDYVVHVEHGIGRYAGLTRLAVRGVEGDFLLIEYAGRDKIYLPVQRLRLVQKYVGGEGESVRLDKLGGQTFAVRKRKVKEELLKMAAELLDIYAARKAHPGTAFTAPDGYYRQFEAEFPYEETPDQARAIDQVISDMQRAEPMDRLVCGDVGFGKTEVALRAAFKAVLDHKQVAVLVPTTVLAAQHEATFLKRFEGYPVVVETVSRFRSAKETREILGRVREGKVDVLIGTHRLLNKDLSFKDLGLLVIDEEQRFGVKQKEQIKKLRKQVDVLTLTATPIPRTLHMSLSGIRDLSIIATPPVDRRSVRTFVSRFEGPVVKEAIERELARGGQVFFVHNRVESIGAVERWLRELMPELRMVVAHGQMTEHGLEKAMVKFLRREADVLLSTAIIESGLDIPSANTILINRADTFGLAQLYQLRGRVGRSRERAYAYMLVPARRPITADARKRLAVIQQLTELGSGFRLASHDLEIRGAGNLLGPKQSGQIAAVGFDLYTQMLEEAVQELRGEPVRETFDPEVNLPVAAFIPDDYVPDVHQRLDFYKRFAQASSIDALHDLRAELVDRYGELPEEVDHLTRVMELKQGLSDLQIRAIDAGPGRLVVTLGPDARLDPARLTAQVARDAARGRLRLTPELKLVARIDGRAEGEALLDAADALLQELRACAL